MTTIEQATITACLTVAAIVIALWFPHAPDLSASTRAMLHSGFEGRTVITTTIELRATPQLLRRTFPS